MFPANASCFLSVCADGTKMTGKEENRSKMNARLKMQVDVEDPTPLLDQVSFGCTQREAEVNDRRVMRK